MRFVFAVLCLGLCTLNVCYAAEAASLPGAEGVSLWYKSLIDLGIAGSFIGYLIYDRHVERGRKDKENERWISMDAALIGMVKESTAVNMEMTAALKELRKSNEGVCGEMQRMVTISSTGSDYRRRAADKAEL